MKLILLTIILFISAVFSAQDSIPLSRDDRMDKIVSNVPKEIRKDFNLLHDYLIKYARDDADKVFMFYGYIAANCKYDYKMAYSRNRVNYTPEYTCRRKKGVCIDFTELFEAFCKKSNITCYTVCGKSKVGFWFKVNRWVRFNFQRVGHAWNVVKVDDSWRLMDVTWSRVDSTRRFYEYDKRGDRHLADKLKYVNREWFDVHPDNFILTHKPYHPAFYLKSDVPTFKTGLKKESKRISFEKEYDYITVLDSIELLDTATVFNNGQMTVFFDDEMSSYSNSSSGLLQQELNYYNLKRVRAYKPTKEDYIENIARLKYIMIIYGIQDTKKICDYEEKVLGKVHKMEKREEKANKS